VTKCDGLQRYVFKFKINQFVSITCILMSEIESGDLTGRQTDRHHPLLNEVK